MMAEEIAKQPVILIVDDNATNLGVIVDYLGDHGFKIMVARNGETGLQRARLAHPDLILLDVMMPEMDGFEVCQHLKADEKTKDIPIIFMTALSDVQDKVRAFQMGGVDYITKPIQHEEVLVRVRTHLQIRQQAKLLQQQYQELEHQRQISDSLREVATIINSTLDRDAVLDHIMEQLGLVLHYDGAAIFLRAEEESLTIVRAKGFSANYLGYQVNLSNQDAAVQVFRRREIMAVADVRQDSRWQVWKESDPIRSWMGAPLLSGTEVMGVLTVDNFAVGAYHEGDKQVLGLFAHQAATAIQNARLYTELTKLNTDKDKFFSIVAHDLKGPFMPLLGNAELLTEMGDMLPPAEVKQIGASIQRTARNVFNLLENLLTWARLQMGRMEYQPEPLDLGDVAQQTVNVLSEVAEMKGIQLLNQVDPGVMVYVDGNMVDTVIRNLANNALKFTSQGGRVTIAAQDSRLDQSVEGRRQTVDTNMSTSYGLPSTHYIEVSITDTGVGISEDARRKLFKIDQHVTTIGTGKETGTGLGLIICQEMVVKSGGHIWVESEVGKGTKMIFTLPIYEPERSNLS